METQFTIAILTSPRKQAMIPQGLRFCILLYRDRNTLVKTNLSVRYNEQQATVR